MSSSRPLAINNLILRGSELVAPDSLDVLTPTENVSGLGGHFAVHLCDSDGRHLLARDPLGVNKLFFAVAPDGRLDVSNYFIHLCQRGHSPSRIWSIPSGHIARIHPGQKRLSLEKYSRIAFDEDETASQVQLSDHAAAIRQRLEDTFRALARVVADRPLYVTMSGGLDSTGVAVLAREFLGKFVGVTFSMEGTRPTSRAHDDLHHAQAVASTLGVPLEVVSVSRHALLSLIDPVLLYGQDYRDFNVHCGLVNAAIAAALQERFGDSWQRRPVVLTGDTMNELMADYTPVAYGAREYYGLPRVSIGRMRRLLVLGLDSGDREVGIFAHYGLDTIQPYALCPEIYLALPALMLSESQAKQRLAREVFGKRIPSFTYDRPKVRAQVGNSEEVGGTLAALIDQGINAAALEARFAALYGFDFRDLKAWIRGGSYRFTSTYPAEEA